MVSAEPVLAAGQAQVGVELKGGQLPADGLSPGDAVQVLRLPAQNAAATVVTATATVLTTATVFSVVADPALAGGRLIALTVPQDAAAAAASGTGSAALARVAS